MLTQSINAARFESDGSLKYQRAIALLEGISEVTSWCLLLQKN